MNHHLTVYAPGEITLSFLKPSLESKKESCDQWLIEPLNYYQRCNVQNVDIAQNNNNWQKNTTTASSAIIKITRKQYNIQTCNTSRGPVNWGKGVICSIVCAHNHSWRTILSHDDYGDLVPVVTRLHHLALWLAPLALYRGFLLSSTALFKTNAAGWRLEPVGIFVEKLGQAHNTATHHT